MKTFVGVRGTRNMPLIQENKKGELLQIMMTKMVTKIIINKNCYNNNIEIILKNYKVKVRAKK
jgi:hypothetical protein